MTPALRLVVHDDRALTPAQERLVEIGTPLIEPIAADVARRYHRFLVKEELLGHGAEALDGAARRYDQARYPVFQYYAREIIRCRMLDAVRSEHFSLRARVQLAMDRAAARFSVHHTLDVDMFWATEDEILGEARSASGDVLAAALLAGVLEAQRRSPEDDFIEREETLIAFEALHDGVATLRPHELAVIKLVYESELTHDEAARQIGVSVNTVQRRHVSGLRRLRAFLAGRGVTHAVRAREPMWRPGSPGTSG